MRDPLLYQHSVVTPEQQDAARQAEMARVNAAIAARQAREAAAAKATRERELAEGTAELQRYREEAAAAWRSSGGTLAEFESAWPKLKQEYLTDAARERMTRQERMEAKAATRLRASGQYARLT